MVMPRAKILFSTGCVSQVNNAPSESTLVMYVDPVEIRTLHPYFATPSTRMVGATVADDILAEGAYTSVDDVDNTVNVPVIVRKPFSLRSSHRIYRISPAIADPEEVKTFPHVMESNYYYWTRLERRKSPGKKKK
jgi:hypothetical protein